jgi:hypothetical protein
MKLILALFLGLLLFVSSSHAVIAAPAVTKAQVLKAIDEFQKDPSSKEGFAAGAIIIQFVKTSPSVHVSVTRDTAPWLTDKNASDADTRNILLTAFVAGNISPQLKSGHPGDDVYAGWEQVLNTYAQLLRINSAAKIEEVEDLKKKEADGTLLNYATEVEARK